MKTVEGRMRIREILRDIKDKDRKSIKELKVCNMEDEIKSYLLKNGYSIIDNPDIYISASRKIKMPVTILWD